MIASVRFLILVTLLGGFPVPPMAWAAPADQVEDLIRRGLDLRTAGDALGALAAFQRAHELAPSPRTLTQMGFAEQSLRRWTDAEGHLTAALSDGIDPWIKRFRTVIQKSLDKVTSQVARVEISGEPAGAVVLVNGQPAGKLPLAQPVRVNAGSVDVEVQALGYVSGRRTVALDPGQLQPVVIRLAREAVAVTTSLNVAPKPLLRTNDAVSVERGPVSGDDKEQNWWTGRRVLGAGLVGGGAAASATGVVLLLKAGSGCDGLPKMAVCNHQAGSRLPGGLLVGAGIAAVIGGAVLLYSGRDVQVAAAVTPWGLSIGGAL